jgi:uncharacterized RDD family membrane protein YckC
MTTNYQQPQTGDPVPGVRLGLPASGPGAVAGVGRRLLGMVVDIAASYVIAALFVHKTTGGVPTPGAWATLVFLVESVVLISVAGQSLGMAVVRVRVISMTGDRLNPGWALVRTVLLLLLIPAVIWDADRRGLHDKASGAIVVNA